MICLDTNVPVYAVENHPMFGPAWPKILEDLESGRLEAASSALTLAAAHEL
ncbi:MAG: hypothetical protein JRM99_06930 [Nitrososphaerota archaeon]|nr:hypothetical protein [Nitrososphaerota archaeon]